MKTRLNLLNRTANAAKISGGGNSHARCGNLVFNPDGHPTVNRQSTIASLSSHYSQYALILTTTLLLLFTLGVGEMWADVWIRGDMNNWANNDAWKFNDGKLEVSLEANTDYTFKVWDEVSYENNHYRSYDLNGGKITGTIVKYNLDKDNVDGYNLVLHTDEAGTYIFQYAYEDSKYKLSIYFPKARLQKQKYVYFDARRLTGSNSDYWQRGDFTARFYFKYYDSGENNGNLDCTHANALEDWVYYVLVPNHDYIGQIQMNRLQVGTEGLCVANIAYAKDRPSSLENCLQEESGKENYCNEWTPQWTTYCPPMSSVTLADNGTTTWGGNGSSETPYLVPTDGDIKVHVTASTSALDDANMTQYFLFKKEGSAIGEGSASTEKTITASSTTGIKEAVIVEAYNYYNSTEGTHLPSSAIYYEARTPYTISYNKGANGTGSRESEIKLKDVTITLPGAVFTRTGYTQTGWATSDGGTKAYDLSASYTANEAVTLFPHWTPKPYTIRLEGMEADGGNVPIDVNVTYDGVLSPVTPHTKTNYTFDGYWTSEDVGVTLGHQLIDANGNWIKDVTGYTGNDGADHPTWVHDYAISLYAKWTETPRTITLNVSPDGAGSFEVGGEAKSHGDNITAYIATPTPTITATPAHAAWRFKEWRYSTGVGNKEGTGKDNTVQVTADRYGTLTAVFEPRFALVGDKYDESGNGGMPGWKDYTQFFTVNSTEPLNLTCTRTLEANTRYKFQVHDNHEVKNLGAGSDGQYVLLEGAYANLVNQDKNVTFTTTGAGQYIFHIYALDGDERPTIEIRYPHQVNFGRRRVDIDGGVHDDDTGGTLVVKSGETTLSSGDWVNYGENVKYDAATGLVSGYTQTWYKSDSYAEAFTAGGIWNHALTSHDNVYAQFTENATTVTISANNTRGGSITVGGSAFTWGSTKTAGVTTKRALVVTPNTGYNFTGWTLSSTPDFELQGNDSETDTEVTLAGLGDGSSGTLTANFAAKTYTVTLNDDQDCEHNGSATATYHTTALSVSTHAVIDGWMRLGYWNTSGIQVTDANGSLIANVENYTNSSGEWIYNDNVTLYAHWYREVTLDKNGGTEDGQIGVDYKGIGSSLELPTRSGYSVEGFYAEAGCTTKVMNPNGSLLKNVSGYTDSNGKWISKTVDKLYAKWIFIIYRTGDKAGDPRAQSTDVESYAGGTISEAIEYRMKVHTLNQWTTLCLPFEVNAVKVWDPADGPAYFDIVPYYRTGGKFYNGHYIIRTPKTATDLAIAEFDQWDDPTSATGYVPAANTPYIIQWHDDYFLNKYISFFGAAGQEIPTSMTVGAAPSSDNVVNVYGNDAMVSGSVAGAYMLEGDYGSAGAWLRLEDASAGRTVLPFECYIRANSATTTRYRILRRGAVPDDTPTGWDDVINAEPKTDIMVYTITGFPVARYYDCSFAEAAQRLHREQGKGIYILRSANESVKLMVGGQ